MEDPRASADDRKNNGSDENCSDGEVVRGGGSQSKKMSEPRPGSDGFPSVREEILKFLVSRFARRETQWHLVGDPDAISFKGHYFLGVIGDNPDVLQAQVD